MRCFGRDNRDAFTLLELLVVIAIVALIAGVSLPAATRLLAGSNPRESLREVRAELAMARAEALRSARDVEATVTPITGALRVGYLERRREAPARWVDPSGGESEGEQRVVFDPMGLASRKELVFSDPRREPGTIWLIPFDPVSGRVGEPRTREEQAS